MEKDGTETVIHGPLPTCDICKEQEAKYDGKTIRRPWAYMCKDCYLTHGVGLGIGRGQKLIKLDIEEGEAEWKE